jgi:hypothetical protein
MPNNILLFPPGSFGGGGGGGGGGTTTRLFYADQLDNPVNSNWAVNALAPAVADSVNPALTVRRFDDTIEEGVGFILQMPTAANNITFTLVYRAQTAPGAPVAVQPKLYIRGIPNNAAITAFVGTLMATVAVPANAFFQYASETFTFAALGLVAGQVQQFELTRVPGVPDTLAGDWDLLQVTISYP